MSLRSLRIGLSKKANCKKESKRESSLTNRHHSYSNRLFVNSSLLIEFIVALTSWKVSMTCSKNCKAFHKFWSELRMKSTLYSFSHFERFIAENKSCFIRKIDRVSLSRLCAAWPNRSKTCLVEVLKLRTVFDINRHIAWGPLSHSVKSRHSNRRELRTILDLESQWCYGSVEDIFERFILYSFKLLKSIDFEEYIELLRVELRWTSSTIAIIPWTPTTVNCKWFISRFIIYQSTKAFILVCLWPNII